jgi:ABC-type dipeptide/oligopeptide/nickel transport system permease subunit
MIPAFLSKNSPAREAFRRLCGDKLSLVCLCVVVIYALIWLLATLRVLPLDYMARVGGSYDPPGARFWLGTDLLGRDVLAKTVHGIQIAFSVGIVASLIAIPIGAALGAVAGYFGGWVDEAVVWLYTTVASVPQILLLVAITFVLGRGITSVYAAIGLTSWVGICRLIRGEILKHKEQDYVSAARALGAGSPRIIFRHILPNLFHIIIIDFSLRFVSAIKSEVILSYLGLGVQGEPSWGIMIADAREELLRGIWWQITSATGAMFFLVLSLNIIGDSLRDILDPRSAG